MNENSSLIKKVSMQYLYYILVAAISLLMLIVLPCLNTDVGLSWNLPDTMAGWIVWISIKVASAGFNLCIFHLLNKQGFLNIQHDKNYLRARELLLGCGSKDLNITLPRSEKEYNKDVYGKKALSLTITSLLGSISLSQAILHFDLKMFIVQICTLIFGLLMGAIQMKRTEEFYTVEYLEYATMITDKIKQDKEKEERMNIPQMYQMYPSENIQVMNIPSPPNYTQKEEENNINIKNIQQDIPVPSSTQILEEKKVCSTIQPPLQTWSAPVNEPPKEEKDTKITFNNEEELTKFIKQILNK